MSSHISEFADAALTIVGREGLAALTFRSVAAESGWSLGAVQKAFASKQELLHAALDRAQSGVTGSFSAAPATPTLERWLVSLVLATLPLDAERRAAVVVGVAFADRAPFDEGIAQSIRVSDERTRAQLVRLFAWRRSEGELVARLDDATLTTLILAFTAGLAAQLLYDPQPPEQVQALVSDVIRCAMA